MNVVYVELLEDVAEGGRSFAKAEEAAKALGFSRNHPEYPRLKVTNGRSGRIEFKKGLVITMPKDGADKWVDSGIGKIVDKPADSLFANEASGT